MDIERNLFRLLHCIHRANCSRISGGPRAERSPEMRHEEIETSAAGYVTVEKVSRYHFEFLKRRATQNLKRLSTRVFKKFSILP